MPGFVAACQAITLSCRTMTARSLSLTRIIFILQRLKLVIIVWLNADIYLCLVIPNGNMLLSMAHQDPVIDVVLQLNKDKMYYYFKEYGTCPPKYDFDFFYRKDQY